MRPLPLLLATLLPGCDRVLYNSGEACDDPAFDPQTTPAWYTTTEATVAAAAGEDGELDEAECAALCADLAQGDEWLEVTGCAAMESGDTGAGMSVRCEGTWQRICPGGRPPRGTLARGRRAAGSPRGRWLGRMATMEAAAVLAFRELAVDLARLGAPPELVVAARAAADDEVRHARVMARLARAAGGTPARLVRRDRGPADLAAFAAHNAAAGCVAETWSALVAVHQGLHAPPALRPSFAAIARDEVRHAELAWAIHRWALDAGAEPGALRDAVRDAAEAVRTEASRRGPTGLGLPTPARARRLAAALDAGLWTQA